jgi:DNA repair exonuclease SbcCD nuclease subunit
MAKYLLMGDVHLSDTPPSSCFDSYNDDLFDILTAATGLARRRQVDAIVWAGDTFHHKAPTKNSHANVARLIRHVTRSEIKHYAVVGNHDITNDRLDSLYSQPLGVVFDSGAVEQLNGWMAPYDLDDDGAFKRPVYGVPWQTRFDATSIANALAEYVDLVAEHQPSLVVTHAPLYPSGQENPYESVSAQLWADAMDNIGSVYYGHIHEPHGIYKAAGVTFCNPGAISRGSLHEYNLTRPVCCALWDSDTGRFEIIELPHKPAERVFRLEEVARKKQAQVNLDDFLDSIGQAQIAMTSVESVMVHIDTLELAPPEKATIRRLLEDVS